MTIFKFVAVIGSVLSLLAGAEADVFYYFESAYLEHVKSGDAIAFQSYYNPWHNQTFDFLRTLSHADELSSRCRSSLNRWLQGLTAKESWALKFLESTGKTVNGRLIGRDLNFGSFEFCTNFVRNEAENVDFDGKYCMVSVQTRESELIRQQKSFRDYYGSVSDSSKRLLDFNLGNAHGVCLPSSCEINELASVANRILKPIGFSVLPPSRCTTASEPEPLTSLQIFSFCTIGVFVFLCFLSFFFTNDFLSNFSLVKHYNLIYGGRKHAEEQAYLHGVKALMMICSISAHAVVYMGVFFAQPYSSITSQNIPSFMIPFIQRFLLFASQLAFLGGFFSMFAWYDVIKTSPKRYNLKNYFMVRYFRLVTISIPMLLLFFVLPQLGSGPYYSDVTNHLYQACRKRGYKFFAMITNLGDDLIDMCNAASWYISTDFQLLAFAYCIIYYLCVKPKIGLLLSLVQCICFTAVSVIYLAKRNVPGFLNLYKFQIHSDIFNQIQDYHFMFFHHFNAYVLGIICAFLVKAKIKPKIIDHRSVRIGVWAFLIGLNHAVFMYPHNLEKNNQKANEYVEMLYPVIGRFVVSLALFWSLYSTGIGYTRYARRLLSWDRLVPWSRLSFGISLLQFIYIPFAYLQSTNSYTFRTYDLLKEFYLAHMFTFFLSNAVFLFMEGPLISLYKRYSGMMQRSEMSSSNGPVNGVNGANHEPKNDPEFK